LKTAESVTRRTLVNDDVLIDVYGQMLRTRGCSVDELLCDPEDRTAFLTEVRRQLGDIPESDLLRRIVNLRKRSKLPRSR
jgi:hypothetical protein